MSSANSLPPTIVSSVDSLSTSTNLAVSDTGLTAVNDSLKLHADSIAFDSVMIDTTISDDGITEPVFSEGDDSTVYLLGVDNRRVLIYGNAKVTHLDMEITADFIDFDMVNKIVFARGTYDTLKNEVKGRPVFKQGAEKFDMDSMYFNLESKKAKIYTVITQQSEGFLHGEAIKRMPDNTIYVSKGKYTTCDASCPHFYLALSKAKVVPNDKVVSSFAYFVIEDVPTPLFIPFGLFPQNSSRASGIIMPSYGEERNRGFFFRDGGYYFSINDYIDLAATGSYYTLGSWQLGARSSYRWKYHFSGGLNLNYASNVIGEPGSPDYNPHTAFSFQWTHTQDPKFSPNKTFAASVNITTSSYRNFNENSLNQSITNTTQSSISYSQTWAGTPFSMSVAATHSHNTRDSIITLGLPTFNFNMARITPFKRKNRVGAAKWYENIGVPLTVNLQNTVSAKEDEFSDFNYLVKHHMKNGLRYNTALSVPLTVAKFINLTPSVSYNGRVYLSHVERNWVDTSPTNGYVRLDTVFRPSHDYDFSTSLSTTTRLYGMAQFKGKFPIEAIRHVASPTLGVSWRPDFSTSTWGIYRTVQIDSTGRTQRYSPNQGGIYGTASAGESASLNFSLGNTLEMKVRSKKDTTGTGSKKIKLLEGLTFAASYNLLADSMNLSNITFSGRTTLFSTLGVSFNGTLNPYALDANGRQIARYQYKDGGLARLTNFIFSFGYSFNRDEKVSNTLPQPIPTALDPMGMYDGLSVAYTDFSLPWSLNVNYSFAYSKPAFESTITQTLGINGNFSLTPKWKISMQSGYDFTLKSIAPTSLSLHRDLHCWSMNFSWIPIGSWQSWNFSISINASMLKDLKYDKRQSRFDQEEI
ncbi:MAG: putative LPS assembly protein LptD [Bacteroidales bacterium]